MTIERRPIVDRESWLKWRHEDVTASTVGALFGCHDYCTALRLYAEKRGVEFEDKGDNKIMRRGRWLEPSVGKAVSELRPEWTIETPNVYLRDPDARIGATPDFFIHGDPRGLGVLQAKTASPHIVARDWDEGREAPLWIVLQCATEMMLADAAFGAVAVLIVDPYLMDAHVIELPRIAAAETKIRNAVERFWQTVAAGEEPEPDFARDADVIKALRPRETAGKGIDLSGNNELPILLDQRAQLHAEINEADETCKQIDAKIKYLMGDAEFATGLNGWRITYKTGHRAGYTVAPKRLRTLRILPKNVQREQT